MNLRALIQSATVLAEQTLKAMPSHTLAEVERVLYDIADNTANTASNEELLAYAGETYDGVPMRLLLRKFSKEKLSEEPDMNGADALRNALYEMVFDHLDKVFLGEGV